MLDKQCKQECDDQAVHFPQPLKHHFDQIISQIYVTKLPMKIEDDEWLSLAKVLLNAAMSILKSNELN